MDLNSIALTPSLVVDLYATTLVETILPPAPQKPASSYMGSNQQHILIVTANPDVPFLSENEQAFLTNILAACKLTLADVAIINHERYSAGEYAEMLDWLQAKAVILFGVDPLAFGLPINFPYFQLQAFQHRTYLYAPRLEEIEGDKTLKAKLWAGLKSLFGI